MKIAIHLFVLALVLGASAFSMSNSFSLPGPVPDFPPHTAAQSYEFDLSRASAFIMLILLCAFLAVGLGWPPG